MKFRSSRTRSGGAAREWVRKICRMSYGKLAACGALLVVATRVITGGEDTSGQCAGSCGAVGGAVEFGLDVEALGQSYVQGLADAGAHVAVPQGLLV